MEEEGLGGNGELKQGWVVDNFTRALKWGQIRRVKSSFSRDVREQRGNRYCLGIAPIPYFELTSQIIHCTVIYKLFLRIIFFTALQEQVLKTEFGLQVAVHL